MNAIYLLACLFARSPTCSELEPIFFTRALHEINVALDNSDRLVDIVQASSLLAVYLYSNCRTLEGYCHSFSAARLAVGLGLHQIHHPESLGLESYTGEMSQLVNSTQITPIPISAPRDRMELMDRISAFWQVFMVDRCWSVANGLPVALPDSDSPQIRIKTPWPSPMIDPEIVSFTAPHRKPSQFLSFYRTSRMIEVMSVPSVLCSNISLLISRLRRCLRRLYGPKQQLFMNERSG